MCVSTNSCQLAKLSESDTQHNVYHSREDDQVVQYDYFAAVHPGLMNWIDPHWNVSAWAQRKFTDILQPDKVRLLHFAHEENCGWPPHHMNGNVGIGIIGTGFTNAR